MSRRRDVLTAMAVAGASGGVSLRVPALAQGASAPPDGGDFAGTDLSGGLPPDREFVLTEKPNQPQFRDATNVWIEDARGTLGMRIGVEAVTEAWSHQTVWLDIAFADGRLISYRSEQAPIHDPRDEAGRSTIRGAGPARFQCIEPFRRWLVTFQGEAEEMTTRQVIDDPAIRSARKVKVECEMELKIAAPPWVPGALLPEAAKALGGEQGEMVSPRYEQLCRASGTLRVAGKDHSFGGQALRIRRSGYRKFEGFWGHCWQSALFPSGKGFGFNAFPPRDDGKPSYAEGFVFDGSGRLIPARPVQIPWMTQLLTGGEPVPLVLETLDGKRFEIDGTTFSNVRSRTHGDVPAGFPIVQQSHALYRWDGEETTGMIERSTLAAKMKL